MLMPAGEHAVLHSCSASCLYMHMLFMLAFLLIFAALAMLVMKNIKYVTDMWSKRWMRVCVCVCTC